MYSLSLTDAYFDYSKILSRGLFYLSWINKSHECSKETDLSKLKICFHSSLNLSKLVPFQSFPLPGIAAGVSTLQ